MSKYYTPIIEEFHIGFEFEFKHSDYPENGWGKYDTPVVNVEYEDCPFACSDLSEYRVKYLDKFDIENLGFKIYGKGNKTFHVKTNTNYILHLLGNFCLINKEVKLPDGTIVNKDIFYGIIKNKSELKVLLKTLGI